MDQIPVPDKIDPDRIVINDRGDFTDRDRADFVPHLRRALHESCECGQRLWPELDAGRAYLLESLPPAESARSQSPTMPRDDDGWTKWMTAYASVTSVLAGPHGDSGHGEQEARHEMQLRH